MDFTKLSNKEKLEFLKSHCHSPEGYWEKVYPEAVLTFGKDKKFSDELAEIMQDMDLKELESVVHSLATAVHSINISVDERIAALAKKVSDISEVLPRRTEVLVQPAPGAIGLEIQKNIGLFTRIKRFFV